MRRHGQQEERRAYGLKFRSGQQPATVTALRLLQPHFSTDLPTRNHRSLNCQMKASQFLQKTVPVRAIFSVREAKIKWYDPFFIRFI